MPIVRIDAVGGRRGSDIRKILDAAHRAVVQAFGVPLRDRYQIYQEHPEAHVVVEDTGLGLQRSRDILVFTITSRPRSQQAKQAFYKLLCQELNESCGLSPQDVVVTVVTNTDADWSFGQGRAQFLTGEL